MKITKRKMVLFLFLFFCVSILSFCGSMIKGAVSGEDAGTGQDQPDVIDVPMDEDAPYIHIDDYDPDRSAEMSSETPEEAGEADVTETMEGYDFCDMVDKTAFQAPSEARETAIPVTDYLVLCLPSTTVFPDMEASERETMEAEIEPYRSSPVVFWTSSMYAFLDMAPQPDGRDYALVVSTDNTTDYTAGNLTAMDVELMIDDLLSDALASVNSAASELQGSIIVPSDIPADPVLYVEDEVARSGAKQIFRVGSEDGPEASLSGYCTVIVNDETIIIGIAAGEDREPVGWYLDFVKSIRYDPEVVGREQTSEEMMGPVISILRRHRMPDIVY